MKKPDHAVPRCVVFTPDGCRRSAARDGKSPEEGHRLGRTHCERMARAAFDRGVKHVVIWAASLFNLERRDAKQVANLFDLFGQELQHRVTYPEDVRLYIRGNWMGYVENPHERAELQALAARAQDASAQSSKKHLTVLFGYHGRSDLYAGVVQVVEKKAAAHEFFDHIQTAHLPHVDLHIRTGCRPQYEELRAGQSYVANWSAGLLPVQTEDSILYFTEKLWLDFDEVDLDFALASWDRHPKNHGR